MTEWIKVEDGLPTTDDPEGRAVVFHRAKIVNKQSEFETAWIFPKINLHGWIRSSNITHWFYLDRPEKPKTNPLYDYKKGHLRRKRRKRR